MRFLSLFSGVGGLDRGVEAAGHTIVAHCEVDEQCQSVLRHHWPDTPIHGDVTELDGHEYRGRVDAVCGGSPCQDLSVAGRREGLDGQRSGLFWHQCRIATESAARWVLWENVAGALSSNDGRDFAAVLWGLTGTWPEVPEDGWRSSGVCVGPDRTAVWRLLDARWFGVAQRRRRVFVVAGPREECGPEVLIEPEGSPRDHRTCEQARAKAAAEAGRSPGRDRSDLDSRDEFVGSLTAMDGAERPDNAHAEAGWLVADDTATALTTRCGSTLDDQQIGQLVAEGKQRSFTENGHGMKYAEDDGVTGPLRTTDYKRPESHIVVSEPDTFVKTHRAVDDADAEHWNPDDTAPTLNVADNTGDVRATVLAVDTDDELYFDGGSQSDRIYDADGVSPSLNAKSSPGSSYDTPTIAAQTDSFDSAYGGNSSVFSDGTTPPVKVGTGLGIPSPPAVAYPVARRGRDDEAEWEIGEEGTYNSLRAGDGSSSRQPAVLHDQPTLAVRRLTPRECERLMSWPDDWTRWNDQGDEIADSVRYRMCGNGVVSNVAEWIARRLPQ